MESFGRFQKYVDYIKATGQRPLSVEAFDGDWEPIGPSVRQEMERLGLIYMGGSHLPWPTAAGIFLRPDLE